MSVSFRLESSQCDQSRRRLHLSRSVSSPFREETERDNLDFETARPPGPSWGVITAGSMTAKFLYCSPTQGGHIPMPTQNDIATHLGLDQAAVSRHLRALQLDLKSATMDEVRLAYLSHLRRVAADHRSVDGVLDLAHERAMTEQVDRDLKQITLAEKRAQLVNLGQLDPELGRMVAAFRTELLSRDERLKSEIDRLYGVDLDLSLLQRYSEDALLQLKQYDAHSGGQA